MLRVRHWERHLLDMAHQALDSDIKSHSHTPADVQALDQAYRRCEEITRQNSKTFHMAAALLPPQKRRATQALYAFCRVSDDMVDLAGDQPGSADRLASWRRLVLNESPLTGMQSEEQAVNLAWADARRTYEIPSGYVDQLIEGLSLDLRPFRYETFNDLARYCYGVACTVGLMSMHITGYIGREAIPYAIRLGVALQLTNILRDVGEDWRNGRLYLPLEELHFFGLSEDDVAAGRVGERWRAFMRFQIQRAHRLYEEALPGVAALHPDGRFAIAAAGQLYRAILHQIEAGDYNVFSRRASVGMWGKLRRLPAIWLQAAFPQPLR